MIALMQIDQESLPDRLVTGLSKIGLGRLLAVLRDHWGWQRCKSVGAP